MVIFRFAFDSNYLVQILKLSALPWQSGHFAYQNFRVGLEMVSLLQLYLLSIQLPAVFQQCIQLSFHLSFVLSFRYLWRHDCAGRKLPGCRERCQTVTWTELVERGQQVLYTK
jgi:hypothetical protein